EIFGYQNPSARQYAVHLGLAFQLTNILRDIAEDARRGRIYLPREDLGRFGCREEDVLAGHCTDAFRRVMAFECARAGEHYGRHRTSRWSGAGSRVARRPSGSRAAVRG